MKEFAQQKLIRIPFFFTTALSLLIGIIMILSRDKNSSFVSPFLNAKMTNYFKLVGIVSVERFLPSESDTLFKLIEWLENNDFSAQNKFIQVRIYYKDDQGLEGFFEISRSNYDKHLRVLEFNAYPTQKTWEALEKLYEVDINAIELYYNHYLGKAKVPDFLKRHVPEIQYLDETPFWLWTTLKLANGSEGIQKKLLSPIDMYQELRLDTENGDTIVLGTPNELENLYPNELGEFWESLEKPDEEQ